MKTHSIRSAVVALPLLIVAAAPAARADEPEKPHAIAIAGDSLKLSVPGGWKVEKPRSRIIEHEFSVPPAKDDERGGRVTIMSAGGGAEANLRRWYDQFKQPDGSSTKDRAKVNKHTIAGQEVTLVDIAGTYNDKPSPMAPGVERPNYRMLGAIIVTKKAGDCYVKFYGPQRTVGENAEAFQKMIEGMQPN